MTWDDHDDYPIADWRYEAGNGDTMLGYGEWREHKIEADRSLSSELAKVQISLVPAGAGGPTGEWRVWIPPTLAGDWDGDAHVAPAGESFWTTFDEAANFVRWVGLRRDLPDCADLPVWVVFFAPVGGAVGGFDWYFTEDHAHAGLVEHVADGPGHAYRVMQVDVPDGSGSDLHEGGWSRGSDGITTWIDDQDLGFSVVQPDSTFQGDDKDLRVHPADPMRDSILSDLAANGASTLDAIADRFDMPLGPVAVQLTRLANDGLIEQRNGWWGLPIVPVATVEQPARTARKVDLTLNHPEFNASILFTDDDDLYHLSWDDGVANDWFEDYPTLDGALARLALLVHTVETDTSCGMDADQFFRAWKNACAAWSTEMHNRDKEAT